MFIDNEMKTLGFVKLKQAKERKLSQSVYSSNQQKLRLQQNQDKKSSNNLRKQCTKSVFTNSKYFYIKRIRNKATNHLLDSHPQNTQVQTTFLSEQMMTSQTGNDVTMMSN